MMTEEQQELLELLQEIIQETDAALRAEKITDACDLVKVTSLEFTEEELSWNPLHFAALIGDKILLDTMIAKLEAAELLEQKNKKGSTPLKIAVLQCSEMAFEILYEAGAHFPARVWYDYFMSSADKKDISSICFSNRRYSIGMSTETRC